MNAHKLKIARLALLAAAALCFAGCQKKQGGTTTGSSSSGGEGASGGASIVSAEKNSFDEVTSKLDKGGSLYLYLSTEQALGNLSKGLANLSNTLGTLPAVQAASPDNLARGFAFVNDLIADSGVQEISGFGASSIAREEGFYRGKLVLHHYEGQNKGVIWSVFGQKAHPLKELDLLPEKTAFAHYSDVDAPLAWKTIQDELKRLRMPEVDRQLTQFPAQFNMATGLNLDDVLGSLGGGYGIIFTVDESKKVSLPLPTGPVEVAEPGLAIYIKVKSDVIFDRVDAALSGSPMIANMVLKNDTSDVKSRTVVIPVPVPFDLKPTIARSGDYLFLTSTEQLLQDILEAKAGKKPGFKSTPEFQKLTQGIKLEGNSFTLVSETLGRTVGAAMQEVMAKQKGMMGAQSEAFSQMLTTNSHVVAFSVSANGPQGWEVTANGNKSLNAMLLPAAAGAAGLVAAVALPAIAKARSQAQDAPQYGMIIQNLRLIDTAKAQCALARNLANGAPVSMDDLTTYLTTPIIPVAGEFYIPNPVGIPPKARLGQAMHGHQAGAEISTSDQ